MEHLTPTPGHSRYLQQDIQTEIDNMRDLHDRICQALSCGYIHADELAALFFRQQVGQLLDSASLADALLEFAEKHLPHKVDSASGFSRHEQLLQRLDPHLTVSEQLCFYLALTETEMLDTSLIAQQLFGRMEPTEPFARGTIAYQHSIYADEAFLHFSRLLPSARAIYSDNFSGVCEQVFNGKCEYCILPLESTQDGKLVRFYQLIEKFELKIVLTCNVTTSDNRNSTVFGLCRRGLTWPHLMLPDKAFCFEFVFWQEPEHAALGELLTAAAACSLSLVRVDCLPRSDEEILIGAGYPFALCLEANTEGADGHPCPPHKIEREFLAFLLYLTLRSPTYLPLGIYQQI